MDPPRTRKKRFGKTLEAVVEDRETRIEGLRGMLEPIRRTVQQQAFLGGDERHYADYILFGAFQWPRVISTVPPGRGRPGRSVVRAQPRSPRRHRPSDARHGDLRTVSGGSPSSGGPQSACTAGSTSRQKSSSLRSRCSMPMPSSRHASTRPRMVSGLPMSREA